MVDINQKENKVYQTIYKNSHLESGFDIGLKVVTDLLLSDGFGDWILEEMRCENLDLLEMMKKTLNFKSVLEISCLRMFVNDRYIISIKPTAEDKFIINYEKLNKSVQEKIRSLVMVQGVDGFSIVEKNNYSSALFYKAFVHDNIINHYFEKGLGLLAMLSRIKIDNGIVRALLIDRLTKFNCIVMEEEVHQIIGSLLSNLNKGFPIKEESIHFIDTILEKKVDNLLI